jgi:tetratricopeptide (TPR) repeat protein
MEYVAMDWSRLLCRHRLTRVLPAAVLAAGLVVLPGCESNLEKYRKQGVALYQKEQYDQSLQTLNKALTYDQFDAQSNAYAGLIYYRSGNYVQAAYHFNVALQADPSSEEAKSGLTATLIKQDKPDQALDALERAAEMAEKIDDPRWEKSNIKRKYTKDVEERLYLGKVQDRLRIGRTYEKLGDYDNALVYYKKAQELAPRNGQVLMELAALAEKAGNPGQARDYLRQAYLADPGTPGLTEAMTRNGLAISEVIGVPAKQGAAIPETPRP